MLSEVALTERLPAREERASPLLALGGVILGSWRRLHGDHELIAMWLLELAPRSPDHGGDP
jgi:hypothetical protein